MSETKTFTIPERLALDILEVLRLAHIYVLKDSHPEELSEDFKKHKWDGFEIEFAAKASNLYRQALDTFAAQRLSDRNPDLPPEYVVGARVRVANLCATQHQLGTIRAYGHPTGEWELTVQLDEGRGGLGYDHHELEVIKEGDDK